MVATVLVLNERLLDFNYYEIACTSIRNKTSIGKILVETTSD